MIELLNRVWLKLDQDLNAGYRLAPAAVGLALVLVMHGITWLPINDDAQQWINLPVGGILFAWILYCEGRFLVWRRRRDFPDTKFRSSWHADNQHPCPKCYFDLPDEFEQSDGVTNVCPQCGFRLDSGNRK